MSGRLATRGFWGTVTLSLGGVWLLVAPNWVGRQAAGAPWATATRNDVAVGATLLVIGFAGMFAQVAFGLRDLIAAAQVGSQKTASDERAPASAE